MSAVDTVESEVRDLVEKMLKTTGRRIDLSAPFVDAMLASQPARPGRRC